MPIFLLTYYPTENMAIMRVTNPRFTQPLLYKAIAQHPNPRDIYATRLIEAGVMTQPEVQREIAAFDEHLEEKFEISKGIAKVKIKSFLVTEYKPYRFPEPTEMNFTPTEVSETKLKALAKSLNSLPDDKKFFGKIIKVLGRSPTDDCRQQGRLGIG